MGFVNAEDGLDHIRKYLCDATAIEAEANDALRDNDGALSKKKMDNADDMLLKAIEVYRMCAAEGLFHDMQKREVGKIILDLYGTTQRSLEVTWSFVRSLGDDFLIPSQVQEAASQVHEEASQVHKAAAEEQLTQVQDAFLAFLSDVAGDVVGPFN